MVQVGAKAEVFQVRTPLMKQGRLDTVLAKVPGFELRMKSYAQGGENALHAHVNEDHAFIVLQGKAEFHDQDEHTTVLGRNQGIMIPRGTFYWFISCGDEPLVMLRVGSGSAIPRIAPDGHEIDGKSEENKTVEPIILEGSYYE